MSDIGVQSAKINYLSPLDTQWTKDASAQGRKEKKNWQAQVGPAYQLDISQENDWANPEIRQLKRTGQIECQTCKERTYQDGSNDPGVSFKAPGHISPESSAAVVQAHEQEHVVNEQASARSEGREVVAQSVRIFTSVCPECGKAYVSGGETRTTTAESSKKSASDNVGANVDMRA